MKWRLSQQVTKPKFIKTILWKRAILSLFHSGSLCGSISYYPEHYLVLLLKNTELLNLILQNQADFIPSEELTFKESYFKFCLQIKIILVVLKKSFTFRLAYLLLRRGNISCRYSSISDFIYGSCYTKWESMEVWRFASSLRFLLRLTLLVWLSLDEISHLGAKTGTSPWGYMGGRNLVPGRKVTSCANLPYRFTDSGWWARRMESFFSLTQYSFLGPPEALSSSCLLAGTAFLLCTVKFASLPAWFAGVCWETWTPLQLPVSASFPAGFLCPM